MIRTASFSTGVFRVFFEKIDGCCQLTDAMTGETPALELWFNPDLRGLRRLEVFVHEPLHAEFPEMSEEEVTVAAKNISRFLWRLGYRIPGERK